MVKPWIAVFDQKLSANSPVGSCVLAEVLGLADEYDITVFADSFENTRPDRVQWVRVPLPARPGFLKYVVFHLLAPAALRRHSRVRGGPPTLIQATSGQFFGAQICYAHFCHRAYLANQWKLQKATGLRRFMRWSSYHYNAASELRAYKRTLCVVSPSSGLTRELVATYPFLKDRIRQIANPVDVGRFSKPTEFDTAGSRRELGVPVGSRLLCFAALGDFERKGLGVILDAMVICSDPSLHLVVVGGNSGEMALFRTRAAQLGLAAQCTFVGFQKDVRPFLWASDVFLFPSTYEIFSLVCFQACIAGLPVIATRFYGFEDLAVDGHNAWLIERTSAAMAAAITDAFSDDARRAEIGAAARLAASRYGHEPFVTAWRALLREMVPAPDVEPHVVTRRSTTKTQSIG